VSDRFGVALGSGAGDVVQDPTKSKEGCAQLRRRVWLAVHDRLSGG
jgi:hypothetical protein